MAALSFWRDTVTVIIPKRIESANHSSGSYNWDQGDRIDVDKCYFEPSAGTDSGEMELYDARLFMSEAPVGFNEYSKVEWRGETFVVMGRPLPRRSPTGAVDHWDVRLRSENAGRTPFSG